MHGWRPDWAKRANWTHHTLLESVRLTLFHTFRSHLTGIILFSINRNPIWLLDISMVTVPTHCHLKHKLCFPFASNLQFWTCSSHINIIKIGGTIHLCKLFYFYFYFLLFKIQKKITPTNINTESACSISSLVTSVAIKLKPQRNFQPRKIWFVISCPKSLEGAARHT